MRKIIIYGVLKDKLTKAQIAALRSMITHLIEAGFTLCNTNGAYIGAHINICILQIAKEKGVNPSTLCEQYVPPNYDALKQCNLDENAITELNVFHHQQMLLAACPDMCLILCGGPTTHRQWLAIKTHGVPCLGVPQFEGVGSQTYQHYKVEYNTLSRYQRLEHIPIENAEEIGEAVAEISHAIAYLPSEKL